jgi:hypothetical protein
VVTNSDDPSQQIKVVDRRRFTDDGEVRSDWEPENTPASSETLGEEPPSDPQPLPQNSAPETQPPKQVADPPPRTASPGEAEPAGATSQLFLELVGTLAQQAELLIHGAEGLPPQPDQAQRVIDYLGILESKTRGNLSAEETQILSNIVFQLRTLYVQKKP